MKKICLLGATGSIGASTVDVVLAHPDLFKIVAFSFHRNLEKGRALIKQLQPQMVAVADDEIAAVFATEFPEVQFVSGVDGMSEIACLPEIEIVLTAVMGSVGLKPTLKAIEAKKDIALANKETLVTAGHIVMKAVEKNGVKLLPVDSEHAAIFQCLQGEQLAEVDRLIITASGGSFRDKTRAELADVTVKDALNHPNWSMGQKITIDSATMMNKGFEVIEAYWLFGLSYDKIEVVLHQESVIHSLVSFIDGSLKAQLGASDMREPIQYALAYPERIEMKHPKPFDLAKLGTLHIKEMDYQRFPLLALAFEAGRLGGSAPTVLNAANEVAVAAFLAEKISFIAIEELVTKAVREHSVVKNPQLEAILEIDKVTRELVSEWIEASIS